MKKTLALICFLVLSMLLVSCQKERNATRIAVIPKGASAEPAR